MEQTRPFINEIRRQAAFIGHIMREEGLEHLITMEELEGRHGRGNIIMMNSLAACTNMEKKTSIILTSKDRGVWKDMIHTAMKQGN